MRAERASSIAPLTASTFVRRQLERKRNDSPGTIEADNAHHRSVENIDNTIEDVFETGSMLFR